MSCASHETVALSPYTAGLQGGATLYPIATFAVDRGRIRLPMEILGDSDDSLETRPWLPCPGASADAPRPSPEPPPPSSEPPSAAEPLADPPATASREADTPAVIPAKRAPVDTSVSPSAILVLLGALFAMVRATSRIGA